MKILFAASEAAPFFKSGGLGDVLGSLPKELLKKNIDVRVIIPKYSTLANEYKKQLIHKTYFYVSLGWRKQYCGIEAINYNNVTYYFVDNQYYFNRPEIYGYYDEAERYIFFSKAVLNSIPHLDFCPDIIHCHDWQTSLIPYLLNLHYKKHYKNTKTVFTIHNLKYQGRYSKQTFCDLTGLNINEIKFDIEYHGDINMLKGAINNSDFITTVSPTYKDEIQSIYYGECLNGVLKNQNHKLKGILNGIDYEIFNPKTDKNIFVNYSYPPTDKKLNKLKLQKMLGITVCEDIPIISIVSRLVEQKGIDLISHIIYEILNNDLQLIVQGSGEERYENFFKSLQEQFPQKVIACINFDTTMALKIYAGSDIFLMPSRFEPCGISQMIAMRYGCIPIVRETGGLKDTVIPYDANNKKGNGLIFRNYNAHELLYKIQEALHYYHQDKKHWSSLIHNAMNSDFSWTRSAEEYYEIYQQLNPNS